MKKTKNLFLYGVRIVALEIARRREFAEFVADHVFRDIDRQESAAIVHSEIQTDEIGRDGRAARAPACN